MVIRVKISKALLLIGLAGGIIISCTKEKQKASAQLHFWTSIDTVHPLRLSLGLTKQGGDPHGVLLYHQSPPSPCSCATDTTGCIGLGDKKWIIRAKNNQDNVVFEGELDLGVDNNGKLIVQASSHTPNIQVRTEIHHIGQRDSCVTYEFYKK